MENELKNNPKIQKPLYKKWWFWLIVLFFLPSIIKFAFDITNTDNLNNPVNTNTPQKIDNWVYKEEVDKMTSEKQYLAYTTSTNKVDFEFPYNGGSTFILGVGNKSKENNIVLLVSKGQFMMSIGYSDTVRIKFDDEKPMDISYSSPSDGSSDRIFLSQANTLISKLKVAKKVMIEAEFFDEGNQVIEFNVEGFKWDK